MTGGEHVEAASPPRNRARAAMRATTAVLAAVGAIALLLSAGVGLLILGLRADDVGVQQAVGRLDSAAEHLPGVASAMSKPGLGDLGTQPSDIYGDVHLSTSCTLTALPSEADRLAAVISSEHAFRWHPTVWCRGLGVTVSPVAAVTRERLAVLALLAADRSLTAAAVVAEQRGDDPSPDLDDSAVQVELYTRARASGAAAVNWLGRVRSALPAASVIATTGRPGDYLDPLGLQDGQWTVIVQVGDPTSSAVLRTAVMLESTPTVVAGYCDGPGRQIAARAATWHVLRDLQASLPAPGDGRRPMMLSLTVRPDSRAATG